MLKPLILLFAFSASASLATDGVEKTALERWQADPELVFTADEVNLEAFIWEARAIVVFADSGNQPAFREQIELLQARFGELELRDVVVITDTDPAGRSDLRQRFRPRGFMLAIIGKDGKLALRKPFPWDVREISRAIDKMPIRRQELRDAKAAE